MIPELDTREFFNTDMIDGPASQREGHTQQLLSVRQIANDNTIEESDVNFEPLGRKRNQEQSNEFRLETQTN